ncbi:uncharacterized protein LOC9322489 isoform X1 [Arabidopsis lyrata subsp. lyrata]|uniref:uncharacterized protein LOC9322489 isoform X1 n=2 Tax=Arabidopsis lyrata subsp. lyrata TaxID=81972 RepID=UPI000A29C096|nr:uncharacterized protein LOC9322489 isoform X1 [Arabidopsis lyrata subsp. lyrata]|eukprot:XP_020889591.1 uncharacterized protein LOC9322489 isoform X1 [Arabidopsis lyrata subsp. lyrata]
MEEVDIDGRSPMLGRVYLSYEVGSFPKNLIPPHIRRDENKEPKYTTQQECVMMRRQVRKSKGFDIDFTQFRSVFNYRPVNFDCKEYSLAPETTRGLLERLSRNSLKNYNKEWFTEYEFLNVVKANSYMCSGIMFFITFEVRDPYDNLAKLFQARVRYYYDVTDDYILCRPKPNQKVKCVGTSRKHKSLA